MTAPDQPASAGTLHALARHLVRALAPLDEAFRDADSFERLMFTLGWQVEGLPPEYVTVADQVLHAMQAIDALRPEPSVGEILGVIGNVGQVYQGVTSLSTAPPGVDPAAFLPEIGRRLFEYLLARDLLTWEPRWFGTLQALGVITFENVAAANGRPGFMRWRFDWDQIPAILSDPGLIPQRLYGWGTPDFAFTRLATVFTRLLHALGVPVAMRLIGADMSAALQGVPSMPPGLPTPPGRPSGPVRHGIEIPLFDVPLNGRNERVGFTAKAAIDRKDFGLVWNQALETGGVLVSDRVDLELEVQAVRAAAAAAA